MSAMTNLLVKDDTVTTPVEYTLQPISDTPAPNWRASVAGVPLDGQIRLLLDDAEMKSGAEKRTVKLEVPVMETLGASGTSAGYVAPPKVAYVNTAVLTLYVNKRSTTQDVANLVKMLLGLAQGASSTTATGVLNQASAGNAVVNSTLPVTLFLTSGIKPH